MCTTTKVAIIGAGGMLPYHVKGFREAGAEIVAIADPNTERLAAAAEKFAIPKTFPDLIAMLYQAIDFDAVSIIAPNHLHKPLVTQALSAGKHVFCEKPPALNAKEVLVMIDLAQAVKKTLMFNFNNRHRHEAMALKRIIEQGRVDSDIGGRNFITAAQALWIRRRGIPGFGTWFTDKAQSGGGALIDLLHMIDLALWLMGYPDPAWVLGNIRSDFAGDRGFKGPWGLTDGDGPVNVEMAAHGFVLFKGGQSLHLRCSWAELNEREEVSVNLQGSLIGARLRRLFGQDGIDDTAQDSLTVFRSDKHSDKHESIVCKPDPTMGRVASAAHFINVVNGLEGPLSTPEQALTLMRIIDAVYESAAYNGPVSLL